MSFWNLSDNANAADTGGSFEMGGGNEPIPEGTRLNACIDEAKWDSFEDDNYISLRWTVLDGDYKNRKIFQKVRVLDGDSKKADKAKRMLAAIDANCGGRLVQLQQEPTDADLMSCLLNRPMWIQVMVWEMNDRKGNWVNAVGAAAQPPADMPTATDEPAW